MIKGMVEIERILPIINEFVEKNHYTLMRNEPSGGKKKFAYATGLSQRWIFSVYSGEKRYVDSNTLDRVLTALNLTHLTYWEKEEGGFKDVFDNLSSTTYTRGPYKKKSRSTPRTLCECGSKKHHRAKRCNSCHLIANQKKKTFCQDCGTEIGGKGAKRCWPCWDKFRKSDKEGRKGYVERRDGMRRVLKKRVGA